MGEPEVDKLFEPFNSATSPGCAIAVIKERQIIYKRGYGMADLEHEIPIQPNSVFHIASHSKQFTAAAIVLLNQAGQLSCDDDVRKYITEVPDFGTSITIRHLIYHTSGLCDQWALLSLAGWRYSLDLISDQDVIDVMAAQKKLVFKPGEEYRYCNTNYTLLAQIVKRVSGKSLRQFTTEQIFKPLGMDSTHFRDDHAEVVKNIAYGYVRGKNDGKFRLSVPNFDTVGATSLLTTVEDLAKWDQNFYEPVVGGRAMVRQMLERGKLNNGEEIDYSFGLVHGMYRGMATISHGGADAGYRAELLCFPEQYFSVACLGNLAEIRPAELCRKVADIYLASDFIKPEPVILPAATNPVVIQAHGLKKFVGLYWNDGEQSDWRVCLKEDILWFYFYSDECYEMKPIGANRFRLSDISADVEFQNDKSGIPVVVTVLFAWNKQKRIAQRATEFNPTPDQLAEYVGVYRSEEVEPVYRISVEESSLVLRRIKYPPAKMEPKVVDNFACPLGNIHFTSDLQFRFFRNAQDKVNGFAVSFGSSRDIRFNKCTD